MNHSTRASLGFGAIALLGQQACVSAVSAVPAVDGACEAQVIVGLATGVERSEALMTQVADRAQVRLHYLRAIGSGLFVFELSARAPDGDCEAALQRLRSDARIRLVERDGTRQPHESGGDA